MSTTSRELPEKLTTEKPNRREFLYYVGGASLALLAAGSCGLLARFWSPPLRGEKGGIFEVNLGHLPKVEKSPVAFPPGRYWLVNLNQGLLALHGVCTHMLGAMQEGCLPKWVPSNGRFECPCCGSKYRLDGSYIEGPTRRGLDRFILEVTSPEGTITTPPDGSPVNIDGATQILVDTNRVIYGKPRGE